MTLYDKALKTVLASRFVARADDLGRALTDSEVKDEARYQLEDLPHKGLFEGKDLQKAKRQMKGLMLSCPKGDVGYPKGGCLNDT